MIKKIARHLKNNKKNSIILVLILTILFLLCINTVSKNQSLMHRTYYNDSHDSTVGGVWDTTEIKQYFVPTRNNLTSFSLRFGTFMRVCSGDITVSLIDTHNGQNIVLFSETLSAAALEDNQYRLFSFSPIDNCKGRNLVILITAEGSEDKPVTLWCSAQKNLNNGLLTINNVETAYELNSEFYYTGVISISDIISIGFYLLLFFAVILMAYKKIFIFSDSFNPKYLRALLCGLIITFAVTSVSIKATAEGLIRGINTTSLIALCAVLAISIAVEHWVGLYKTLFSSVKNECCTFKQMWQKKDIKYIIIRFFLLLSTTAFVALITVCTAIAHVSKRMFILAFAFALLTLISHIVFQSIYKKNAHPAILFLAIILVVGALFAYTFPISTSIGWDEQIHYRNSLDLKNHIYMSENRADYYQSIRAYFVSDHKWNSQTALLWVLDDTIEVHPTQIARVNIYTSITYLPTASVMLLADFFSFNFFTEMVLAKMANIIVYGFVIYAGLKKLKSGIFLFSSILLLPTCVFETATFTYDTWTLAFIAYSVIYMVSELQNPDKKIRLRDCILMFGSMILGCGTKAVYFTLMLPMLFFSKKKFESVGTEKKYRIACVLSILFILLSFTLPFFGDMDSRTDLRGGLDVNAGEQVKFILTNPFKYIAILFNFLTEYLTLYNANLNIATYCLIGNSDMIFGTVSILLIIICAIIDRKKEDDIGFAFKGVGLISAMLSIVLVTTALYVSFTPVKLGTVNGCQFRYLFPVMPTVFYFINFKSVKPNINQSKAKAVIFGILSANLLLSYYSTYIESILI